MENDKHNLGDGEWLNFNDIPHGTKKISEHEKLKRQAIDNDRRLQDLVTYELTKGLTITFSDNDILLSKFAEYKRHIKKGCFTLEQLETMTLKKYAITNEPENSFEIEVLDEEPEHYLLDGDK